MRFDSVMIRKLIRVVGTLLVRFQPAIRRLVNVVKLDKRTCLNGNYLSIIEWKLALVGNWIKFRGR
jgi:hypothetical protein